MKKPIIIILGVVFVVAAAIVSIIFAFGGSEELPKNDTVSLEGNWIVPAMYVNDTPTFVQNQSMTFSKDQAAMYKDNSDTPYASSAYSINEAGQLILSDISREYKVDMKTKNCVRLYENTTTYMLLVRTSGTATADMLAGKWNVTMKGDQLNNGESLEFSENSLNYYKAGSDKPAASSNFELSADGILSAEKLGLTMNCYPASENTILLIEQSGIVWELTKS